MLSLVRYLLSDARNLMGFALTSFLSTLGINLFVIHQHGLPPFHFLLLGNTLLFALIHFAVLGSAVTFFERSFNFKDGHRFHGKLLQEKVCRWSYFHLLQLLSIPLAVSLPAGQMHWILLPFAGAYLGISSMIFLNYLKFFELSKKSGRTIRPSRPEQFETKLKADAHFLKSWKLDPNAKVFKKRMHGELRNIIENKGGEIELSAAQSFETKQFQLGIFVLKTSSAEDEIEVFFDDALVLKKKTNSLCRDWNDFLDFSNSSSSGKISKVRLNFRGNGLVYFSPRIAPIISGTQQKNVIVIIVDGLRTDMIGLYGGKVKTPFIDRFFKDYTIYHQAYTQGEWTLPTFASFPTSLYSSHHRIVNPHYSKIKRLPENVDTLAEILQRAGYYTFAYSTHPRSSHLYGHERGYERFIFSEGKTTARDVTSKALEMLHTHPDENKFLFLHYLDMRLSNKQESPFCWFGTSMLRDESADILRKAESGKKSEEEHFYNTVYTNKIAELDFVLESLLGYIERTPLGGRTAVILTADHGVNLPMDQGIDTWAKKHLSEQRLSVPLLMRCPWLKETHKKEISGFVETCVDLYPTVADLAGVSSKPSPYSRSFLPDRQGKFQGKKQAISEMIFAGNYQCRIIGDGYEYKRILEGLKNGNCLQEEIKEISSGKILFPEDPAYEEQIKRFRKVIEDKGLYRSQGSPEKDHADFFEG
ncbi:MAG: sulfatase [Candidatus Omnitrophica bacterium]|nr:sulfatase [Candidatus Omnitrophota bacterium]